MDVCPSACLRIVPLSQLEGGAELESLTKARYGEGEIELGAAMLKDEAACIRCSMCAMRCPTGAITMEQYRFSTTLAGAFDPAAV